MSLHIQEKSRYWKCDSCKEFHDAGKPVSHEKADKSLVCCPSGIFITASKKEVSTDE